MLDFQARRADGPDDARLRRRGSQIRVGNGKRARSAIISHTPPQSRRPSTSNHLALFRLASDLINMGAGPRYPYPKEVWTPAGGWWTRPNNWVSNTAVCAVGIALATYGVWTYSADREWRHNAPTKPIPSMNWARQFKEGELSVKEP